ncbi:hypothetical protein N9L11_01585 [Euryarchaeota archaeon]|nr:hypothetical protein [Euryarchaeota archaeon]
MADEANEQTQVDPKWQAKMKEMEPALLRLDGPLKMANLFASTMANAKNAEIETRIPTAAIEWAEMVFNEWFELVGKVAKSYGLRKRLADRTLFDPRALDAIEWREGITIEEIDVLPRDDLDAMYELGPDGIDEALEDAFGPFGDDPAMSGMFSKSYTKNMLSGQYNRLFPLKLVLRTAASLVLSRDEFQVSDQETEYEELHIEELREECLKVAKYAKEQLKWLDKRHSFSVGEKISTGFPDQTGEKSKKQSERFVSQFVGSVRTLGNGLPFEIGLLSVNDEGMISFTKAGVDFMLEKNPIIDLAEGFKEGKSFTNSERSILLRSLIRNAPKEFEYMTNLLLWINQGIDRPKSLEENIKSTYGVDNTSASLMRTGAIARMIELDLVSRNQDGRKVSFSLTSDGTRLVKGK